MDDILSFLLLISSDKPSLGEMMFTLTIVVHIIDIHKQLDQVLHLSLKTRFGESKKSTGWTYTGNGRFVYQLIYWWFVFTIVMMNSLRFQKPMMMKSWLEYSFHLIFMNRDYKTSLMSKLPKVYCDQVFVVSFSHI